MTPAALPRALEKGISKHSFLAWKSIVLFPMTLEILKKVVKKYRQFPQKKRGCERDFKLYQNLGTSFNGYVVGVGFSCKKHPRRSVCE